jgi:putative nucleotidyltransferase with HDIG domain
VCGRFVVVAHPELHGKFSIPRPRIPVSALVVEMIATGNIELPVMPSSASRILALGNDDDIDAQRFATLLRSDVSMVGNLMSVANSAHYAGLSPCTTVREVVVRLGFTEVRQIALALAFKRRVFFVPAFAERMRAAVRHAFATASFAQAIARRKRFNVEEAFMLGLLHDVGEPVLLNCLANVSDTTKVAIEDHEVDAVLDEHHANLGAQIASEWQLSERVVVGIAQHQLPSAVTDFGHVLKLAEAAAETLRDRNEEAFRQHPALEALSFYCEDADAILERSGAIQAACEVIG